MQDALRLNGFAVCTPAAMSPWPERRRSKGAQTKNPAAHLELPDFERSGLCSDAVVCPTGFEPVVSLPQFIIRLFFFFPELLDQG